jgi:hypothetical protein
MFSRSGAVPDKTRHPEPDEANLGFTQCTFELNQNYTDHQYTVYLLSDKAAEGRTR